MTAIRNDVSIKEIGKYKQIKTTDRQRLKTENGKIENYILLSELRDAIGDMVGQM
jgi:hypothetical protein